ncbi:hypothetical protein NY551_18630 [Curtobacterium flaccumfaciens pv. oortii]|uniref:hypothetical protein n=1 Tax=Curtobacterium flaccumfaciens TaxID=2035 RepID=UPI00265B33A5|nr:hypothetical protein [Curtobacterium flaccumfaciens]MCS5524755.1 hypothetical protein [Curtobacterium flaccumfaciens pv. oortii]
MAKRARAANVYSESTRTAVLELSEFFTYRQLSDLIGRDPTTIRQWPDRLREAREPYLGRLMLTYDIVCQLLAWSRTPDIAGYFRTPYSGRTVTQAIHDWTRVDQYDELLEVIADGQQAMIDALTPPVRTQGRRPSDERVAESADRDGRLLADALASSVSVRHDGAIVSDTGVVGVLRDGRALLDPVSTLELFTDATELNQADRRAHYTQLLLALGWLQPAHDGRATRPFRIDGRVRRVWDLPGALLATPQDNTAALHGTVTAE